MSKARLKEHGSCPCLVSFDLGGSNADRIPVSGHSHDFGRSSCSMLS